MWSGSFLEGQVECEFRLLKKGSRVAQIQRATVHALEREWETRIGKARFETFYAVLKELTEG